jgi:hypothetical protein
MCNGKEVGRATDVSVDVTDQVIGVEILGEINDAAEVPVGRKINISIGAVQLNETAKSWNAEGILPSGDTESILAWKDVELKLVDRWTDDAPICICRGCRPTSFRVNVAARSPAQKNATWVAAEFAHGSEIE